MTTKLAPLDPQGTVLGDEVYERLAAAILDGTLPAGERLRDQDLAAMLGVSRTPVREALQRLVRAGLVEVAPHRYTRVRERSPKRRADTHDFIVLFMGNVVRLSVERASDDEIAELLARADDIVDASRASDVDRLLLASGAFLDAATAATDNEAFKRVLAEAQVAIRHNLDGWHPFIECPIERTAAYEELREAIAARDGAAAEARIRAVHGFS
ncbi:GntR family transcriptional regulator [Microbacterium terricola]|nr:GntR family transcriptional regulator [Microbacterium terricola]UYK39861.1 GntR family transcriptional regulator [Microbacterium terricola]